MRYRAKQGLYVSLRKQIESIGTEPIHTPSQDLAGACRLIDGIAEQPIPGPLYLRGQSSAQMTLIGMQSDRLQALQLRLPAVGNDIDQPAARDIRRGLLRRAQSLERKRGKQRQCGIIDAGFMRSKLRRKELPY